MLFSCMHSCAAMSEAGGSPAQQAAQKHLGTGPSLSESDLDAWGIRSSNWFICSTAFMQAGGSYLGGSPV